MRVNHLEFVKGPDTTVVKDKNRQQFLYREKSQNKCQYNAKWALMISYQFRHFATIVCSPSGLRATLWYVSSWIPRCSSSLWTSPSHTDLILAPTLLVTSRATSSGDQLSKDLTGSTPICSCAKTAVQGPKTPEIQTPGGVTNSAQ